MKHKVWLEYTHCGCGSPLVFSHKEWILNIHYCENGHKRQLAHISPQEKSVKID
ncbi:hypothetical protein PP459_gp081 [Streptomyces phage Wakanda]|uniref:Uncharacterized protein n=1 Tax=Streptomyces phage Wakanda TaxID=2713267 RepID=A0A6G8R1T2_9CAUD|nr:hypothetical protein PP459_gp081 [Streptomyces phage Wakanda]QIN94152.1 hypothetical protein SEA_WAKANDA_191 [Streptomyces phage Wakanda]